MLWEVVNVHQAWGRQGGGVSREGFKSYARKKLSLTWVYFSTILGACVDRKTCNDQQRKHQ